MRRVRTHLPSGSNLARQKPAEVIGCFQNSFIPSNISHRAIARWSVSRAIYYEWRIPKSIVCLCARYSWYHVHGKRCDATRSKSLDQWLALGRVQERNDRASLAKCSDFVDGTLLLRTADLQDDVALRPYGIPID